jgi:hypothetical protein
LYNSVNPDSTLAIAFLSIDNCKIAKYNLSLAEDTKPLPKEEITDSADRMDLE